MTAPFDRLYGLEVLDHGAEVVRAQVAVRDEVKQPAGLVHGGVFAAMAESMATLGARRPGTTAKGLSSQTSFLRPILDGTIHATARRRHSGRTTSVWEVEITDDDGRLCALVRVTVATS